MTDRNLPTDQELTRIRVLASWRTRMGFVVFLFPVLFLAFITISRLVPGGVDWPLLIPMVALLVVELGLIAYVSFFLRCPRCSSWTGLVVPKCASCGLKFETPKSTPRHPDMQPTQK